jgi:hypothetical protein
MLNPSESSGREIIIHAPGMNVPVQKSKTERPIEISGNFENISN